MAFNDKKEELHLNGTSKNFLIEFSVFKEKVLNHIEQSDAKHFTDNRELESINTKLDVFINILTEHKTYFKIIGAVLGAGVVAMFTWLVTHFAG